MTQNLSLGWSMLKFHCKLCMLDHCMSHGEPKFNTWAHHDCLNVVCFINLILFSWKEMYVMCICSCSPSLLSPKSIKLIKTQSHQVHKFIKLKLIKLNEDSSPIPSRSSHLPRGLGLPRSNFQNFNSNIHNGPRRNKQSSHIWVFRIMVHLKVFCLLHVSIRKQLLKCNVFLLSIMLHAFCFKKN